MMQRQELLAKTPASFNELLDLFEARLLTLQQPLMQAVGLIRDELDYREGPIFSHITGTVSTADLLAKRLKQIRAAHNAGAEVTITLTEGEAQRAEVATSEVEHLFSQAASVFEMLHTGLTSGTMDPEGPGLPAMLDFARCAMVSAADYQGEMVSQLSQKIRAAKVYRQLAKDETA